MRPRQSVLFIRLAFMSTVCLMYTGMACRTMQNVTICSASTRRKYLGKSAKARAAEIDKKMISLAENRTRGGRELRFEVDSRMTSANVTITPRKMLMFGLIDSKSITSAAERTSSRARSHHPLSSPFDFVSTPDYFNSNAILDVTIRQSEYPSLAEVGWCMPHGRKDSRRPT